MKKILALLMAVLMLATLMVGCTEDTAKTAEVIEVDLTQEFYAFGVDKAQPELLQKVNTFIAQIKDDGTLDAICNKYFGEGTPEAVESAELDESKEQLVVATNAAFEPFEYMEGDKYLGIDMEIAKLLADYLDMELVINNMEFDAVCLSVGQHKCDIAMAGLTINEKRRESVDFSESYYEASQRLIVKADDTTFDGITSPDEIEAKLNSLGTDTKVGYQNGTTGQFYVQGDADWGFNGLSVTGVGYQNGSLAVQDMLNGNLDYVIIDKEPAMFITKSINELA